MLLVDWLVLIVQQPMCCSSP